MYRESHSSSLGLFGICTVVFVILKLTGNINWSWWWVLSPVWIGWIIGGLIYLWAKH